MNKVPIIRKGSIKDYWSNGFGGGLVIGILLFLLSLVENNFTTALLIGLSVFIAITLIFVGIGFTSEEYFKRKNRIKKLTSKKYSFLDDNNFTLHEDLYFEGKYKEFWFRILPMTKWQRKGKEIEYDIIESFYNFDSDQLNEDKEQSISGDYFIGRLHFANNCVAFVPKDWNAPDFKENFDGLINIFNIEKLRPISKIDWEEKHGKKIALDKLNIEKSRTKQILKIGKLDIKYLKPE